MAELLVHKAFREKGSIGFIMAMGNTISDEEMFASFKKNRKFHYRFFVLLINYFINFLL